MLIRQKYKEWSPCPKRSGEEKKELLVEAMAQVNGGRRFDVKKFWTRMYLKKGQEMKRVEEARKKETIGVKMVERVGGTRLVWSFRCGLSRLLERMQASIMMEINGPSRLVQVFFGGA